MSMDSISDVVLGVGMVIIAVVTVVVLLDLLLFSAAVVVVVVMAFRLDLEFRFIVGSRIWISFSSSCPVSGVVRVA